MVFKVAKIAWEQGIFVEQRRNVSHFDLSVLSISETKFQDFVNSNISDAIASCVQNLVLYPNVGQEERFRASSQVDCEMINLRQSLRINAFVEFVRNRTERDKRRDELTWPRPKSQIFSLVHNASVWLAGLTPPCRSSWCRWRCSQASAAAGILHQFY